jgi:hypothetical protein
VNKHGESRKDSARERERERERSVRHVGPVIFLFKIKITVF